MEKREKALVQCKERRWLCLSVCDDKILQAFNEAATASDMVVECV